MDRTETIEYDRGIIQEWEERNYSFTCQSPLSQAPGTSAAPEGAPWAPRSPMVASRVEDWVMLAGSPPPKQPCSLSKTAITNTEHGPSKFRNCVSAYALLGLLFGQ